MVEFLRFWFVSLREVDSCTDMLVTITVPVAFLHKDGLVRCQRVASGISPTVRINNDPASGALLLAMASPYNSLATINNNMYIMQTRLSAYRVLSWRGLTVPSIQGHKVPGAECIRS